MLLRRHFYALCLAFCACPNIAALAEDGSAVLDHLRRYDSIYEAGFTVSGTLRTLDELARLERVEVKRKWRFAFQGDRCGYLMEVLEYQRPKFEKPTEHTGGSLTADGWLLLPIRTKQWGYWGEDCSGNFYEDTVLKISPANEVAEAGKMHNSSLFGPKDAGPNAPKRTILWSLGRLLSRAVDEITLVKQSSDGRLALSALGREGNHRGRWELEIEPAAAWMVRRARFYYSARPNVIDCEMRNSGTVWSGSYCIPEKALFNYVGPIGGGKEKTQELTFNPVVERFDEKLYDGAQRAVAKDRPPDLTIHDHRISPPLIFNPNPAQEVPVQSVEYGYVPPKRRTAKADEINAGSASRFTGNVTSASLSPAPAVQPEAAQRIVQRPWYLLSSKWAIVLLILSMVIAGYACALLFQPRKG